MTPLDEFYARWNAVVPPMPVPLIEVVNTNPALDTMPDRWAGAMVQSHTRADVSLGTKPWVEERGEIVVGLLARSGTGRDGLDDATKALRKNFHGWLKPDNSIHFVAVNGPEDIDPEADGEWYRLGFTIPFVVSATRDQPQQTQGDLFMPTFIVSARAVDAAPIGTAFAKIAMQPPTANGGAMWDDVNQQLVTPDGVFQMNVSVAAISTNNNANLLLIIKRNGAEIARSSANAALGEQMTASIAHAFTAEQGDVFEFHVEADRTGMTVLAVSSGFSIMGGTPAS